MKISYLQLIVSLLVCQGAGLVGAVFTTPAVKSDWYLSLKKPIFQPPDWLFGPVWTILFLLMGIALYLIWNTRADGLNTALPLGIFTVQLLLNITWSYLFFAMQNPFLAFIEIVALWVTILLTMIAFLSVHRAAGLLMLPYLAWVSFAAVLNFSLWQLNRI